MLTLILTLSAETPSFAANTGFVKRVDSFHSYADEGELTVDGAEQGDYYACEFETDFDGKLFTTFCREHEPIESPDYNGVSCTLEEITDHNSDFAKCMYYWGIVKGWTEGNTKRLRLSRMASYLNRHPCMPYEESVVKEWIEEARATTIPEAANFRIYLVTPANSLQELIAFDGKIVINGKLKLKKASSNPSITG